jgi:hypothetical protein
MEDDFLEDLGYDFFVNDSGISTSDICHRNCGGSDAAYCDHSRRAQEQKEPTQGTLEVKSFGSVILFRLETCQRERGPDSSAPH